MCICLIMIELFDLLCICCNSAYIYIPMYLPQAVSHQPPIGAQSDFLLCTNCDQESWFVPLVFAFGSVVGPLLAQSHIWRQSAASKLDRTSSAGSGQDHPREALELEAGYKNPAP
jgi:hypothetical protein